MTATAKKVYEFRDCNIFAKRAAASVMRRYANYIEYEVLLQEGYVWLLANQEKVEGWLAASPQRTTRLFHSLRDYMIALAEQEKAARCGYDPEDVAWYSATLVEGLLPLALDDTFTPEQINESDGEGKRSKPANEGGDLLAMVLDIRRALKGTNTILFFLDSVAGDPMWESRIEQLVDYLGGQRPYTGRRRSLTNRAAQAITGQQEAGTGE